ncbi:ABC transporter ATP-binding protein [Roseivirga sp.]|uniref:ABC transporter ATP-binding protein n=1 Tax=Roseivirga sp. TaxID=1964215 RepID=UPI003B5208CF
MLQVQKLFKKYPGEHYGAVVDMSFELSDCEVLAIVGRSGSGKSTLLRMLAGLMKPDSGSILFRGEPLKDPEEQLIAGHDKIKMVFQDFQVKPNMTVAENIRYKLLHFNKEYQEERCDELLNLCGLREFASKKPRELSGGQQQRLSLARALADDPELLLMDEPFSNLDPIIKEDLLIELTDIVRKEGISLVLVSHDVRDALLIADRIAYVDQGTLLQIDTPSEIYNHPETLDIAQFFGRVNTVKDLSGKVHYIRAEHLSLKEQEHAFEVYVESCTFMGNYYLCRGRTETEGQVVFHTSDQISIEQSVELGFLKCYELHFTED